MPLTAPKVFDIDAVWYRMAMSLRSTLLGTNRSEHHRILVLALALGVFATTFGAYALGVFSVSGGLIWIPLHAALVGLIAGCWVSYTQRGLVFACVVVYASLLGVHAHRTVSQVSGQGFIDPLVSLVSLDDLVFFAVEAIVLGLLAFVLGSLARWGFHAVQGEATPGLTE